MCAPDRRKSASTTTSRRSSALAVLLSSSVPCGNQTVGLHFDCLSVMAVVDACCAGKAFAIKVIKKTKLNAEELAGLSSLCPRFASPSSLIHILCVHPLCACVRVCAVVHDEVEIMHKISHVNCVHLYEMFETSKKIYMVLELLTGARWLFSFICLCVRDRVAGCVCAGFPAPPPCSDAFSSFSPRVPNFTQIEIANFQAASCSTALWPRAATARRRPASSFSPLPRPSPTSTPSASCTAISRFLRLSVSWLSELCLCWCRCGLAVAVVRGTQTHAHSAHTHRYTCTHTQPENLIYQSPKPESPIKITDFGLAKFR